MIGDPEVEPGYRRECPRGRRRPSGERRRRPRQVSRRPDHRRLRHGDQLRRGRARRQLRGRRSGPGGESLRRSALPGRIAAAAHRRQAAGQGGRPIDDPGHAVGALLGLCLHDRRRGCAHQGGDRLAHHGDRHRRSRAALHRGLRLHRPQRPGLHGARASPCSTKPYRANRS